MTGHVDEAVTLAQGNINELQRHHMNMLCPVATRPRAVGPTAVKPTTARPPTTEPAPMHGTNRRPNWWSLHQVLLTGLIATHVTIKMNDSQQHCPMAVPWMAKVILAAALYFWHRL